VPRARGSDAPRAGLLTQPKTGAPSWMC
jgi:hypothetical protein